MCETESHFDLDTRPGSCPGLGVIVRFTFWVLSFRLWIFDVARRRRLTATRRPTKFENLDLEHLLIHSK
jgi:hypothetical protein